MKKAAKKSPMSSLPNQTSFPSEWSGKHCSYLFVSESYVSHETVEQLNLYSLSTSGWDLLVSEVELSLERKNNHSVLHVQKSSSGMRLSLNIVLWISTTNCKLCQIKFSLSVGCKNKSFNVRLLLQGKWSYGVYLENEPSWDVVPRLPTRFAVKPFPIHHTCHFFLKVFFCQWPCLIILVLNTSRKFFSLNGFFKLPWPLQ